MKRPLYVPIWFVEEFVFLPCVPCVAVFDVAHTIAVLGIAARDLAVGVALLAVVPAANPNDRGNDDHQPSDGEYKNKDDVE